MITVVLEIIRSLKKQHRHIGTDIKTDDLL